MKAELPIAGGVYARISTVLLIVQAVLLLAVATRNSVTFDEAQHLPAGISYWQQGQFFAYHHNPPVSKLLFSLPAVVAGSSMDYSNYQYQPGDRHSDFLLAQGFAARNAPRYHRLFVLCRCVSVVWTLLGGCLIYLWTRQLCGCTAAILAQSLWTFSPTVMAHGTLVTPDIAATIAGFAATYLFWRYVNRPSVPTLLPAAVMLGVAIGSKFTHILLVPIWLLLATAAYAFPIEKNRSWNSLRHFFLDAWLLTCVAILILNVLYFCEGSGLPLGRMEFVSKAFSTPAPDTDVGAAEIRNSRFSGEIWKWMPIPLPKEFVLGLDHQLADVDSANFENYLNGEFREGTGWWYYYLYAFAVKSAVGMLVLIPLALRGWVGQLTRRKYMLDFFTLILPILLTLILISRNTSLNVHSRYIIVVYPFLFVLLGIGVARLVEDRHRWWKYIVTVAVACTFVSSTFALPHSLTYFNEFAGGPRNGYRHLVDSNVDWGQGLVALNAWLDRNLAADDLQLAYFGSVNPKLYGIGYSIPGFFTDPGVHTIRPGTHVVSVNYVAGSSFPPMASDGTRMLFPKHGYRFYQNLDPVEVIANCFHVYEVTEADIVRLSGWHGNREPGNRK